MRLINLFIVAGFLTVTGICYGWTGWLIGFSAAGVLFFLTRKRNYV